MIRNKKRLWALLLSAALIVTQLPAVAMAENNAPEDGSIASFAELPSSVTEQTVEIGTELSALTLPDAVTASVYHVTEDTVIPNGDNIENDSGDISNATPSDAEGSVSGNDEGQSPVKDSGKTVTTVTTSEEEISVTWDSEPAYDGNTEGSYVFTADVGGYVLSDGAKLPKITVTVGAELAEKPTESQPGEPISCTQTEGCTLANGHEGDCVPAPPADDGLVKTITSWTFVDDENLNDGVLPLISVSMDNQADFGTVVSMLPTQLSAAIEGEAEPAPLDITSWECAEYIKDGEGNWPVSGEYTFTAALLDGYACDPLPTVKVLLGGANTYAPNTSLTEGGLTVAASNNGEVEYTADSGFTLKTNGTYEISGEWSGNLDTSGDNAKAAITVPTGVTANVTLTNVTIDMSGTDYACAFAVEAYGTANITLAEGSTNTLTSGKNCTGLEVPENAKVTIDGDGSLTVNGGENGAGIGGGTGIGRSGFDGGTITIKNGEIIANGDCGAGIGGGYNLGGSGDRSGGGTVTIEGSAQVTATSDLGAGIGGGGDIGGDGGGDGGKITIQGSAQVRAASNYGAGIGGGGVYNTGGGSGGDVTIQGSAQVTATSDRSAGIGGGSSITGNGGNGADVKISGEGTNVTTKGDPDVGGVKGNGYGSGGSLLVTGGATLEMQNTGTNVTNPEYKGCTIIDKDGNSFKYNSSGLVSPELSLEADPTNSVTLPGTVTLTATLSDAYPNNAGRTITFTVNGSQHGTAVTNASGVATYSITNLSQGGYTFGVSIEGDNYNTQVTTQISGYAVALGTQAALGITGLDSAYTYGCDAFFLSTSGGSGSGAVSYESSEPSIASVTGSTVTIQKAGTFTITATKAADSHYAEAKVTSHVVTVHSATPNMSLTASGGSTTNDPLILTAAVSKVGTGEMPAGTVTFKVGGQTLHSGSLDSDGKVVHTISKPEAGSHTYTVEYSGQAGYYNNTSTSRTIGVGLTDQTGFAITAPGTKTYGDGDFTLATTGGQSSGGVSFSSPDRNGVLTVTPNGSVKIIGAGKVTVTATKDADSTYNQATATLEITVAPRDISNVTVNVTGSRVYTGSQLQPVFEVYDGGNAITTGDYTNSYGTNVAVGTETGSITLTGQRNYTGTKPVQFDIDKRSLNNAAITLESSSYTHTGSEIKPAVTNVVVDRITVPAAEYDVGYANNTAVGTATVTITAKAGGNFSGTASTAFTITKANTPSGGGGNSSNSSNESSVTTQTPQPTANDPNPPTVGKITPTVTVDKDGKVTVSVSDRDIQSAIDKATAQAKKDGTLANGIAVSIDLTGLKTQFNTLPLTLSRTVYQKLVDAGVNSMSIATPQISLSLDLETLKTIYTNATGNVTINAVRAENSKLPTGMQNRPAYDLTIVSGGKQISDFGNGNIAVTLPYALQGTEQGGNLQMAYVDTEGKVQNMTNSSYHANQSAMIGRTNHFTVFGIIQKPAPAFKDIEGHWAKDDILFVASRELLAGTGKKLFSPDTGMTRGMFVTALGRLAGIDQTQYKNTKFSDVAATAYYAPYVAWATEKGIVNGTTDTTFAPDTNISREQMAVIMQNYAKTMGYTVPKTREAVTFADGSSIESWAKDAVKAMQMAGVMNGKDGNRFDPKASATRAEVSAVLHRYVELVIDPATAQGFVKNASGHWYYYKDGKKLTGWQTIGKLRYYFNGDGVMHEGWKQDTVTDKWYYWTNDGAVTGWKKIGTKLYYFDENGIMTVNTKVDGYEIGPDGARK